MIQWTLAFWSLVPLPFLKPVETSGSSWFMYCWSLAWRILSITSRVCEECSCAVVWAFFGIAFVWDCNENWPFPVLWPLLSFPNLLAYYIKNDCSWLNFPLDQIQIWIACNLRLPTILSLAPSITWLMEIPESIFKEWMHEKVLSYPLFRQRSSNGLSHLSKVNLVWQLFNTLPSNK